MAAQPPASGRNNPRRIARDRATAASVNGRGREAIAPEDGRGRETVAPGAASRRAPSRHVSRPRKRWHVVVTCAVVAVVLVAGLVVGGFAYLRWFAADDGADIQGTWYLAGTATPITITEDRICLTDDVSYPYTLDEGAKTIQFSFSNLAGAGCYRFSLDRQQLALVDGQFSGADTLGRDIGWTIQALVTHLQGDTLPPAEEAGKGLTLLSREPAKGVALPKEKGAESAKDSAKDSSEGEDSAKKSSNEAAAGDQADKGAGDESAKASAGGDDATKDPSSSDKGATTGESDAATQDTAGQAADAAGDVAAAKDTGSAKDEEAGA